MTVGSEAIVSRVGIVQAGNGPDGAANDRLARPAAHRSETIEIIMCYLSIKCSFVSNITIIFS